jgi:hypothetical protein
MMRNRELLKERMELLEVGAALGYPRLGYGRSTKIPHDKRIPQGQSGWEKFCAHAHSLRILPALRIGRVLRDNGVMKYHPLAGAEMVGTSATFIDGDMVTLLSGPVPDLLAEFPEPPSVKRDNKQVVAVYPPGKRRRKPSKKNKAAVGT